MSGPYKVSGFAASYEADGLVGVHLAVGHDDLNNAVTNAAKAVQAIISGTVSEQDLARAKAQACRQLVPDSHAEFTRATLSQYLYNTASVADQLAQVEALTLADVQKVAKAAGATRPLLAARGPLDNLPYLDTLGF